LHTANVPERLRRQGRPVDPHFHPTERLFLRVAQANLAADGILLPAAIRFPDFSVNREKYSEPHDVILFDPTAGIACFKVEDIPSDLSSEHGPCHQFLVEHVPEDDNYAHSEVRTYRGGERPSRVKSKTMKTRFRNALFSKIKILKEPLG